MHRVFVYGTLKRGGSNHGHLAGQTFIAQARTVPEFRLYELSGYPGLIFDSAKGLSIHGEIWEVDADCLDKLDRLEGIDEGLYTRVPIRLLPPNDAVTVEAYLYLRETHGCRDLGENFPV
jgi:gamma-glutamylcyclotransferase (GGCT)/AIG2-like uncharacterized protein YtfP